MKPFSIVSLIIILLPFSMNSTSFKTDFEKQNLSFVENSAGSNNLNSDEIKLIMRADDIGFSHAANLATINGYKEGVITSTEILTVGPWFLEAAELLNENPGLDVGVHLVLPSEWKNYKWGPVTMAKSLVTKDVYFAADNTEFQNLNPDIDEVEIELRAQIKLALKYIPQVSHLSFHMGTAGSTPELQLVKNSPENLIYRLRTLG